MFVNMVAMRVMQVAVMQIVGVTIVKHSSVAAVGAVLMVMIGVVSGGAGCHVCPW